MACQNLFAVFPDVISWMGLLSYRLRLKRSQEYVLTNWLLQKSHRDVKYSTGNIEAKEYIINAWPLDMDSGVGIA